MLTLTLNVDAYCNIYGGYLGTARHFMKSGRVFTALSFFLANYAKISFTNFSLISVVLSNIFISLKEFDTYNNEQFVFNGDTLYLLIF